MVAAACVCELASYTSSDPVFSLLLVESGKDHINLQITINIAIVATIVMMRVARMFLQCDRFLHDWSRNTLVGNC